MTRDDVARHAGVSVAVVSYVVNDGPRTVAEETRRRVLESIRELGYRPNAMARALKRGRSELIGLVVSDTTNPFFAEYGHAIEEAASERGLSVIFSNSALAQSQERDLVQKLVSRQVDGLLLASTQDEPELGPALDGEVPVVLLDRASAMPGLVTIGTDFRAASARAVEHLIEHGHHRIGMVSGYTGGRTTSDREAGWADALRSAGLERGPLVREAYGRDGGYDAGRRILREPEPPTAIFASSDLLAIGLVRAAHEAGVDIPSQLAVISFDGSAESQYSWPPLTTMRQPVRQMARAAVDALAGRPAEHHGHEVFESELIIRVSCGCGP
ncbi:LacI family DNA-binding transcriptional regulator [Agromyces sp. SYSU T0242]|uniref:LacI family DNA-binding transcriptional regulator n=1 Tax=Agromyces litoreus TaxID=3158561 RepID=UPI0033976747